MLERGLPDRFHFFLFSSSSSFFCPLLSLSIKGVVCKVISGYVYILVQFAFEFLLIVTLIREKKRKRK